MADDWLGDPFAEETDPEAAAREQRRREREERRARARGESPPPESPQPESVPPEPPPAPAQSAPPPSPPPPPPRPSSDPPPPADRPPAAETGEYAFEGAVAAPPRPPAPPPARRRSRRGPLIGLGLLATVIVAGVAVAAVTIVNRDEPTPPPPVRTSSITIPEGLTRSQTAEVAREAGLRGDYMKATVSSGVLDPAGYGGKDAKNLEGFLFPDTYEVRSRGPVADLVRNQLETFRTRFSGVNMKYAKSKNLTVYDVVTIASMVEREAMLDGERKLIAAVIYNRLREGIPLGIDATTRFASGNFSEPLTESELASEDPYNTRVHAGLPPGPIANPGLASLEAAARPAKVDYLYYVVEPGTCGKHAFSSSDAEFQEDVARYNAAREEAGGESPDTC